MKTFALILIIIGIICVIAFSIAFFVELYRVEKPAEENKDEAEEKPEEAQSEAETQEEFDLDAMLARLEANAILNSAETEEAEQPKEVVEEQPEEVKAEEPEVKEEVVEEQPVEEQPAEASVANENIEEVVEADNVEVKDAEEKKSQDAKVVVIKETKETRIIENINQEDAQKEDVSTQLDKVKEAQTRVNTDLAKVTREINKYERTERRMARNQKLLDKKAEDLTKLNLVLYSVTDIKNIDADKKQKQEELTEHINELKASIKDAQDYLNANKEKYENNKTMKAFFEGEEVRLANNESELLKLSDQKKTDKKD